MTCASKWNLPRAGPHHGGRETMFGEFAVLQVKVADGAPASPASLARRLGAGVTGLPPSTSGGAGAHTGRKRRCEPQLRRTAAQHCKVSFGLSSGREAAARCRSREQMPCTHSLLGLLLACKLAVRIKEQLGAAASVSLPKAGCNGDGGKGSPISGDRTEGLMLT